MRTAKVNIYKFNELSTEAKEKAIQEMYDINVFYGWWDFIYMDAENIGLKITSFGLDRNRHAKGKLLYDTLTVANNIIKEHGENTDTYQRAKQFIVDWDSAVYEHSDKVNTEQVAEGKEDEFDVVADELEAEFETALLEEYSVILQKECEYLISDEAIINTIEANEYEFLEDGTFNTKF